METYSQLTAILQCLEAIHTNTLLDSSSPTREIYLLLQAVLMEDMRTREEVEGSAQNRLVAGLTALSTTDGSIASIETLDVLTDLLCAGLVSLHLLLEASLHTEARYLHIVDLLVVILKGLDDGTLEVLDGREVGEERKNVLNSQRTLIQQGNGGSSILVLRPPRRQETHIPQ